MLLVTFLKNFLNLTPSYLKLKTDNQLKQIKINFVVENCKTWLIKILVENVFINLKFSYFLIYLKFLKVLIIELERLRLI